MHSRQKYIMSTLFLKSKIEYREYPNSDEAVVSISLRKAKRTYTLKKFDRLSSAQAGRILGRYIYNNI